MKLEEIAIELLSSPAHLHPALASGIITYGLMRMPWLYRVYHRIFRWKNKMHDKSHFHSWGMFLSNGKAGFELSKHIIECTVNHMLYGTTAIQGGYEYDEVQTLLMIMDTVKNTASKMGK